MSGLRQRKKQAAMRHIQLCAVRLFQERGFDQVTVEQIAQAAEVSPSSIYRYFGTKEGLVLHDEHDERLIGILVTELEQGTPILESLTRGLDAISHDHFQRDREATLARTGLWAQHAGIQAAAAIYLRNLGDQMSDAIVAGGRYSKPEARVIVAALTQAMITAIFTWYDEGARHPPETYFTQALTVLADVFHDPKRD
jgi:transcriptional regulator, tetR family